MRDWLRVLQRELHAGASVVRVVVKAVRGSAPREPGASMLVAAGREIGTIGGGHLELVATRIAREHLKPGSDPGRTRVFPLATSLGQCCGGIVELWFQRYEATDSVPIAEALRLRSGGAPVETIAALASLDPDAARYERFLPELTRLWIFGAGHVGRALVRVLAPLPFAITWVDSRDDAFPTPPPGTGVDFVNDRVEVEIVDSINDRAEVEVIDLINDPVGGEIVDLVNSVRTRHSSEPADEVAAMEAGDWALVLTHSHDEDFAICHALLKRGGFGWAGVIGSQPKAKRFRQRLAQRGFTHDEIARLTMPIGIGGIRSKEPAAIAVGVAAQLLQLREARAAAHDAPARAARES